MTLKERKRRSSYLKRGDILKLSKASGISSQAIGKWINGDYQKSTVVAYFEKLTTQREKEFGEFIDQNITA